MSQKREKEVRRLATSARASANEARMMADVCRGIGQDLYLEADSNRHAAEKLVRDRTRVLRRQLNELTAKGQIATAMSVLEGIVILLLTVRVLMGG